MAFRFVLWQSTAYLQYINRISEIDHLKSLVDRIIPVGIGSGIAGAYLLSLSKNMPVQANGNVYITAEYSDLDAILNCPTQDEDDVHGNVAHEVVIISGFHDLNVNVSSLVSGVIGLPSVSRASPQRLLSVSPALK